MHLKISKYSKSHNIIWDVFIANSSNATFLFHRDFMEYHQDRFDDFSLLIFDNDELLAVFPANMSNGVVHSHQGLTYGGLIFKDALNTNQKDEICAEVIQYLKAHKVKSLIVKPLPEFYNSKSEEVHNFWQRHSSSSVITQHIILAVDYNSDFKIHKTKLKRFNKLKSKGFIIKESPEELSVFWNEVLVNRLNDKHNAKPVHSLTEIEYLNSKFKQEIRQYNIYRDDEVLAGITIFKKGDVVKSQYGMASAIGEKLNALDMLFVYLIYLFRDEGLNYFSMGTVNDNSELGYSEGMLKQKQELGCRIFTQDIWKIDIND
ncbi:GNAT family N-acetyltransferase [Psychroserpens luteolus]|uniref:GNAT family N-acetyltransferase n=1 Tax=Psychroserpens luteolus TaxID=2855840 RepID=UPI001E64831E|nr:GNAT family N-acetyltransferase [Psychroserpens luteolus]MCD2260100.1 GNAT family N-acetyltransferase [Psychroserpens luteolus]